MPIRPFARTLFSAALALSAGMAQTALAQDREPVPRISVIGEGFAKAAPDMAILTLGVVRQADTAAEAVKANNAAMADVIAAMKDAGIAETDLQTADFSVQPRYVYPNDATGQSEPKIVGYTAQNTLTVRIRSLPDTGAVLDRAVSLGVNSTGGLVFTNDDPSAFLTEARKQAMADAVSRAKTLAEAAGVSVGRILDISEQSFQPQPIALGRAKMMAAEAADAAVPIQGGENEYRITVNAAFEIKQ
jgi:hypothetical protein